jgi:putative salt-induced outer membrane protein YdiY
VTARAWWLVWGGLLLTVGAVNADEERAAGGSDVREVLILKNGDRMSGTSAGVADGQLDWELPFGGSARIPLEQVDRVERYDDPAASMSTLTNAAPHPVAPDVPAPELPPVVETTVAPVPEAPADPEWFHGRAARAVTESFTEWTKRIGFGGRFVEGNSRETNLDLSANLERKRADRQTQINLGGQFGQANGVRGVNRWFANSTTDVIISEPWIWFLNVNDEYNERQNLDYRGTLSFGPGWRPYNEDKKRLIVRVGPAVTYEVFHKPADQRVTPDLFTELEFRWPMSDSMQFEHRTTVNPSLHDLGLFRAVSNSAVQWALDSEKRWSFRIGVQYQYISQPNSGRRPGDYFTTIQLVYQKK